MEPRVCCVLPRLLPAEGGVIVGAGANNCISLAMELNRLGVFVEVVAPIPDDRVQSLGSHPAADLVTPLASRGSGLVGRGMMSILTLAQHVRRRMAGSRYNIVHTHSGTYPYAAVLLAACPRTSVRIHSLYCPLGAKGGVYSTWWDRPWLAGALLGRLDGVVAVTDNVGRSLRAAGLPEDKIESIAMSVDTRRFSPSAANSSARFFPVRPRTTKLLFVGNTSRAKGLDRLLHALAILAKKGIGFDLVAAVENEGAIPQFSAGLADAKRIVAESGLGSHVRIIGLVESMASLYAEADVIVIPWQTTRGPSDCPMVLLESMTMGKCVVAAPVGGCPEVVDHGKTGLLAESGAPEAIARALETAVKSPELRNRLGRAALEVSKSFSVARASRRLLRLYSRLLQRKEVTEKT